MHGVRAEGRGRYESVSYASHTTRQTAVKITTRGVALTEGTPSDRGLLFRGAASSWALVFWDNILRHGEA